MQKEFEHEYTNEIVCPYCGHEFSDSFEYDEDTDAECFTCGKQFDLTVEHYAKYTTSKTECEKEHNYIFDRAFVSSKNTGFSHVTDSLKEERVSDSYWIIIFKCKACDKEVCREDPNVSYVLDKINSDTHMYARGDDFEGSKNIEDYGPCHNGRPIKEDIATNEA